MIKLPEIQDVFEKLVLFRTHWVKSLKLITAWQRIQG